MSDGALSSEELLEGLTTPQAQAVRCTEGPLLVLAGPGSGKTRVITRRIAYLLSLGVPGWSILALTFTNKAAGEMRERVARVLGATEPGSMRGLTITTFHSLCARLLRRYAEAAGLKPDFTIYDSGDQATLCKKAIEAAGLSTSNYPPRSVLSAISNAKNELLDPDQFAARAHDFSSRNVAKIYAGYAKALRAANAVDFDDLLLLTARMLQKDAGVRQELNRRWQYLMIDEYQDTNHAQFIIASMLAGTDAEESPRRGDVPGPNICVVGDPDQAIYGWRGADISNILEFEEHYRSAKTITLGENFRSTPEIVRVADTLIRHNSRRKHKDLFTKSGEGERPTAVLCKDERHEAQLVTDWLKSLHDQDGVPWREMAVFYRTNALSRVIEEALRGANVPYTIARGTAFYEREEVKNALSYLRVVANPADDVSLERIVNTPTRGIGDAAFTKIEQAADSRGVPRLAAMRDASSIPDLSSRAAGGISKFVEMIDSWTGGGTFMGSQVPSSLADLVDRVIKESGLEAMYKAQAATSKSETDEERLDNLDELVSSAREFEREFDVASDPALGEEGVGPFTALDSDEPGENPALSPAPSGTSVGEGASGPPLLAMLRAYLESVSLVADADSVDPAQGSVTLMTLHAAKGLEFQGVAMIGLEENTLPHSRALSNESEMEEERRLCFVGVTRAMRHLHMTAAKYRTIRGLPERTIPSRFLSEMPKDGVVFSDQSDTLADLRGSRWDADDDLDQRPDEERAEARGGAAGPSMGTRIANALPIGSMVRHPQFGVGKVLAVTGGVNARATIEFKGVGTKTLVLEYARLTRM